MKVERAHRIERPQYAKRCHHGSKVIPKPRPIVARFETWKQKEKVIKAARAIKLTDAMFLEDYSQWTLEGMRVQIPQVIEARKRRCSLPWIG